MFANVTSEYQDMKEFKNLDAGYSLYTLWLQ